jgi:hypothetical protein
MTLRLELDRILYDPQEGLLHLFATDGEMLVRCAVSKAALTALEDDALAGPDAMIITYRRNREHHPRHQGAIDRLGLGFAAIARGRAPRACRPGAPTCSRQVNPP